MQESRRHHYVPEFLLNPWLVTHRSTQNVLIGYWWNVRTGELEFKLRGAKSFCFQMDLLTLSNHDLGRDAIEWIFFGDIDTKGAAARSVILASGIRGLNAESRTDFARLLLSLEARRPAIIDRARRNAGFLKEGLDSDPELVRTLREQDIAMKPSEYFLRYLSQGTFEDRAVAIVQRLVENPKIGHRLINAYWGVRQIGPKGLSLVLADRPLIRHEAYDHPSGNWILPLTPKAVFISCNDVHQLSAFLSASETQFVKWVNKASVGQAERFVFCTDRSHEPLLRRWLAQQSRF